MSRFLLSRKPVASLRFEFHNKNNKILGYWYLDIKAQVCACIKRTFHSRTSLNYSWKIEMLCITPSFAIYLIPRWSEVLYHKKNHPPGEKNKKESPWKKMRPRVASSLILLAKCGSASSDCNYRVLFVRRSATAGFMKNRHVFPGIHFPKLQLHWKKCF